MGDQFLPSSTAVRLPVRVTDAPVESDVLCLNETMRINRLGLKPTLSTVRLGHITDVLVLNNTGESLMVKNGTLLSKFQVYDKPVQENPPPLPVASVTPLQDASSPLSQSDIIERLKPFVQVSDYPEGKHDLLQILSTFRQAVALPGEPLGVTSHTAHLINLQSGPNPVHNRLPHSQRAIVDGMIQEMREQGVIQESQSPWNSPLFLVPKKDGSYRPVIDFRRVNDVTVSDHYPLSLLNDLLQSISKHNSVFTSLALLAGTS